MKRAISKFFVYKKICLATVIIAAIAMMATFYFLSQPSKVQKPMNVILVSVDSLRADHMSLYGYDRKTTPNIDAWANDATVFENYFSTSYLTPISEASVHTGKYPFSSGVINFQSRIPTTTPTIASVLKQNGWKTAAFGSSPEFLSFDAGNSLSPSFDIYEMTKTGLENYNGRGVDPVSKSLPWIKQVSKDDAPFFLWLPLGLVHWPYGQDEPNHFSDPNYAGYFENLSKQNVWNAFGFLYKFRTHTFDRNSGMITYDRTLGQKDIDYVTARYDDGIVHADRQINMLFDYLKRSKLDKNTIIILQSEHGEGFGERGYILHYDIHDEQVHTPLIIKAPNLAAGKIKSLISGVDVFPTLLGLLHLPLPPVDGENFVPFLSGSSTLPREEVYITRTSLWERVLSPGRYPQLAGFLQADNEEHFHDTAIRTSRWKLIHRLSRTAMQRWGWLNNFTETPIDYPEYELYDIRRDPLEQSDLYYDQRANPEVKRLLELLDKKEHSWVVSRPENTTVEQIQPYF